MGLCLLTPWASAAQRPQAARVVKFSLPAPSELFSGAWRLLARVWSSESTSQTKNGCRIDPHGACIPEPTVVPGTDAGCMIDPYGGCMGTGSSTPDSGCGIDPHGCTGGI